MYKLVFEVYIIFGMRNFIQFLSEYFEKSVATDSRSTVCRCFSKKVSWKSLESSRWSHLLMMLKALNLIEKRLQHRFFPVNVKKCLKTEACLLL